MKLQVLVVGIIILFIGGIIGVVGLASFGSCGNFYSTCDIGSSIGLSVLGGLVFFVGIIVTIIGAVVGVAPHLKEVSLPKIQSPIVRETIVKEREVLIQCRSCGSRYPQGTLKCYTCGANL